MSTDDVTNATNSSIWVQNAPGPELPRLEGDAGQIEVAVIGAGITGLCTAYMLAAADVPVVVLEAGRVAQGATGFNTGKATVQHSLKYAKLEREYGADGARRYAKGNDDAVQQIAALMNDLDHDADIVRCAAHVYTTRASQRETLEDEVAAARRAGLDYALVTQTELPWPVEASITVPAQIRFDPRKFSLGLVEGLRQREAPVYEHSRVRKFDIDATDFVLHTDHGSLRAKWVVIATLLPFLDRTGLFARIRPKRSYCVAFEATGELPRDMYINIESPTRSIRAALGGRALILAGEGHDVGKPEDTTKRYAALEQFAREHFPVGRQLARWSTQDYRPADNLPFIGRLPLVPDRILGATGYDKWGLSTGVLAGNILMHEVTGRPHPCAELFDPRRITPMRSAWNMTKDGLHVARHFVGDRMRHALNRRDISSLGSGEGEVVRHDGRLVAGYRDEAGQLHAVSPVCTHLGCHLNFNVAEKSWDCPCHGSRFDYRGAVLQGPAMKDLERIEIEPAPRDPPE
jgi:glycine/D-amino acid oxidase-like deaminating enzyme/nitrite reductase/ring-hydroxylating ferredoxin subunit